MSERVRPPVWRMIREATEALGFPTTNVAVRDWVLDRYPGTNRGTISCQIIICTVNQDSRVHYPENQEEEKGSGYFYVLQTRIYDRVQASPISVSKGA